MGIPPLRLGVYHEPASGFLGPDLNRSEIKPLGDTPRGTPPFAGRALWNIESILPRHSALMLAARITLPHFSVLSAMSLPKSAGESTNGTV
jgi:hypothetical protein